MQQPSLSQQQHVEALMTPQEQQALRSAGVASDIVAKLVRAFIASLLSELPGLIGTAQGARGASPTKVGP